MKHLKSDRYNSPVGEILILADGDQLCYLDFADNDSRLQKLLTTRYGEFSITPEANLLNLRARLDGYFAGQWDAFDRLELHTDGTDFQRAVWHGLTKIPAGKAISYHQLADSINKPAAIRAAASANARNPISIIIPCHRVIGADGSLRGYAGGVERKSWLLAHEGVKLGQGTPAKQRAAE